MPGFSASSERRCSSASYSASWIIAGSAPASAMRSCARYSLMVLGVLMVLFLSRCESVDAGFERNACMSSAVGKDGVDVTAGGVPGIDPFAQNLPAERRDPVIAARRSRLGRFDETVEQFRGAQVAQHRVERALLADQDAAGVLLQALGDLVAIQRLTRGRDHRQQHQRHGAGGQLLLELLEVGVDVRHRGVLASLYSRVHYSALDNSCMRRKSRAKSHAAPSGGTVHTGRAGASDTAPRGGRRSKCWNSDCSCWWSAACCGCSAR